MMTISTRTIAVAFVIILSSSAIPIIGATTNNIFFRQTVQKILDKLLHPSVYDSRVRPDGYNGTGPTKVNVNMYFRSISKIDDYEMEYTTQITLREQWLDDRLRYDNLTEFTDLLEGKLRYLTLTDATRVWMPDIFFANERKSILHNLLLPNVYIRIFPDGEVLFSRRISLILSCPMFLKLYPFDKQACPMKMASFSWTTDDLIFKWSKYNPAIVTKEVHLDRFILKNLTTDNCDHHTATGIYSCLYLKLLFEREFSYYLTQIFVPCWMLVILSYASFWLDQGAVAERISLGVTTLLTIVAHTSGFHQTKPPAPYITALDVWTNVCLSFVFSALVEFSLVQYVYRYEQGRKNNTKLVEKVQVEEKKELEMEDVATVEAAVDKHRRSAGAHRVAVVTSKRKEFLKKCLSYFLSCPSKRIDITARIIYPMLFGIFNFVYWREYYFNQSTEA